MPPLGIGIGIGIGRGGGAGAPLPSYDADAVTLFAAMSVQPDTTRKGVINQLILDLKAAGVWSKLDLLYVLAAHDEQAGRLNWKAPASFTVTAVNSWAFVADRGRTSDGSTSYGATGWNPSTNGVNLKLNDGSIGLWSRTSASSSQFLMGAYSSPNALILSPSKTPSSEAWVNSNSSIQAAVANGIGLIVSQRTAASGAACLQTFKSGVSVGTGTAASTAIPNSNVDLGGVHVLGLTTQQLAAAFIGASFDSTAQLAAQNAFSAYMTAIGA